MSFAQSLNLPFSFNVVNVTDMLDLNEDLFELHTEETVTVYSAYVLSTMIARPDQLECLMKVIQKINPCVMVISEVEANLNSPVFVNRFIEALFFYSAFFDSMEECMDLHDLNRMISKSINFGLAVSNIVVTEGEEIRTVRHVNISNVWKAFFARVGAVETELSEISLYQASLLIKYFACSNSCTLDLVGSSLTLVFSTSALKFL